MSIKGIPLKKRILASVIFGLVLFSIIYSVTCNNPEDNGLSSRTLDNLVSFAQLYGYVRYFHPSDQNAMVNWDKFVIYGADEVQKAKNIDELNEKLNQLFLPIAPTIKILKRGVIRENTPKIDTPSVNRSYTYWINMGDYHHFRYGNTNEQKDFFSIDSGRYFIENKVHPLPGQVFELDIGESLSVYLPISLYTDSIGTIPNIDKNKFENYQKSIEIESSNQQSVRLASIIISWNIFSNFYPYYDDLEFDWMPVLAEMLSEAAKVKDDFAFLEILRKLVSKLNDGHGSVYPDNFENKNLYYPPFNCKWIENQIVVTKVFSESENNVKIGDVLIGIDNNQAMERLLIEDQYVSAGTLDYKRNGGFTLNTKNSIARLLSGEYQSLMQLKLIRNGKDTLTVYSRRDHINYSNESLTSHIHSRLEEIRKEIFYVDLTRIDIQYFKQNINRLINSKGIIFDIRGYPSGMSTLEILRHLIDKPSTFSEFRVPMVEFPERKNIFYYAFQKKITIEPLMPIIKVPMIFITDETAISYSETIMEFIEFNKIGKIIGNHTAGTNGNSNQFSLPCGSRIKYTGFRTIKQDGSKHFKIGTLPDIYILPTIKGVMSGEDEPLIKAIELLEVSFQNTVN